MGVKGEAQSLSYKPGEPLPEAIPAEEGKYTLSLKTMGKEGLKGWRAKPKKFPNRFTVWTIEGTEDEVTGEEKEVREYISLSPRILRRVLQLAHAAEYPEELDLKVCGKPTDPLLREVCGEVDKLLEYIIENGVKVRASLGIEEFNGEQSNRIQKWLAPGGDDDLGDNETAESDDEKAADEDEEKTEEDTDSTDTVDEDAASEDNEEEEKPRKPAPKKPAPKAGKKR